MSNENSTDLADEGKGLPPHPLGTVAEPYNELVDEIQTKVMSSASVQLLEDFHHLITHNTQEHQLILEKSAKVENRVPQTCNKWPRYEDFRLSLESMYLAT